MASSDEGERLLPSREIASIRTLTRHLGAIPRTEPRRHGHTGEIETDKETKRGLGSAGGGDGGSVALGMKNAPYAATAELKPKTVAASFTVPLTACARAASPFLSVSRCRTVRKMTGIIQSVEPLPIPVAMNRRMNISKNPQKFPPLAPDGRK